MTNPHPQHTAPAGYTLILAPHEHVFIEASGLAQRYRAVWFVRLR